MKRIVYLLCLLSFNAAVSQPGYEIKVTLKPYKNQYIYLGHYFGKTYPVIDSIKLDENSEAVFRGPKNLQGGIYLVGHPGRTGFFEILVDKQQRFSVIADTSSLSKVRFINSPDNELFVSYQQFMSVKGAEIAGVQQQYRMAGTKKDSADITDRLRKLDKEVSEYREELMKKNPNAFLTVLLKAMKSPRIPENLEKPKTQADSLAAYNFYKSNYWDGVNFWDGRLAYTTFFEDKVDKYFETVVTLNPDSVIREIDAMLGPATVSDEMTRFLLIKFINRYLNQKYMWEDAVFVHLFEKYFAQKEYSWLTSQGKKMIRDRAYSLMANIMGTPAAEIELKDSTGKVKPLYSETGPYTVVVFWDPTCGHCKEVLPKIDSFYRAKWKSIGVRVYAVAKETEGTRKDWLDFISKEKLLGWTHVYYSKPEENARLDANIPSYTQLFDVRTFPTLYLLDASKKIIAKKLTYEQIDDVIELKNKGR